MIITVEFRYHEGAPPARRSSLRVTLRAHRWKTIYDIEDVSHRRLIDAPYPESIAQGVDHALGKLATLRLARDPIWGASADRLQLEQRDRMPHAVRTAF